MIRKNRFRTAFYISLFITLGLLVLFYSKHRSHVELQDRLVEVNQEKDSLSSGLVKTTAQLDVKTKQFDALELEYNNKKKEWQENIDKLVQVINSKDSIIEILHGDIASLELLLGDEDLRGTRYLESLVKKRNELQERIAEITSERDNLQFEILNLENRIQDGDIFMANVALAMNQVFDYLTNIIELDSDIRWTLENGYVYEIIPEQMEVLDEELNRVRLEYKESSNGKDVLSDLSTKMKEHELNLNALKYTIQNLGEEMANFRNLQIENSDLKISIANLNKILTQKEKEASEYQSRIDQRLILIASTKELLKMGIIRKRRHRNKTRNINLQKVNKQVFTQISKNDEFITVNSNQIIKGFITFHPEYSYKLISENSIRILDKEKFWENAIYSVLEIE